MTENQIGKSIKTYRERNKLSQAELAKRIGVSQRNVSYYEKGEHIPPADMLKKLANIFNVSVDELLGIEKPESSDSNSVYCPEISNRIKKLSRKKDINLIKAKLKTDILDGITTNDERFWHDIYLLSDYFGISDAYIVTGEEEDNAPLDTRLTKGLPDGGYLLLDIYKELAPKNRRKLLSFALSLSDEDSSGISSVAADEPSSKTGTDNTGK